MNVKLLWTATVGLTLVVASFVTHGLSAQSGAALSGAITSQDEGKMEGVLVTVRPEGGIYTVTVVSDTKGQYSFPRTHVAPGRYAVAIRAAGYDLAGPSSVQVAAGKTAKLDLKLRKTADLSKQLTSLDWLSIMPLTDREKELLAYQPISCNYCHSYQRIVRSKHDEAGLVKAMERMKTYYGDGTASSDDGRGKAERFTKFGDSPGRLTPTVPNQTGMGNPFWPYTTKYPDKGNVEMTEFAKYLARVNLGGGRTAWPYAIKPTLPRPKGKGTQVIITMWDLPRKDTITHDSGIDHDGNLWYGDESGDFVGMVDVKNNTIREYPVPPPPAEHLHGARDVDVDADNNPWFPIRVQGGASYLTKLDRATGKLTTIDNTPTQYIQVAGNKVWTLGAFGTMRIDAKTMMVDGTYPAVPGYQKVVSSKGVVCGATDTTVECLNTANGEKKSYPLPNGPRAYGRRGKIDPQDRYWFAEYSADKIAMLDLNTEKITEWKVRKYSTPYCASVPDRKGYVYAPSNMSDRLMQLDPKTGEVVEFLMPTELDTKEVHVVPSTSKTTVLFANIRNARAVRIEPLD